MRLINVETRKLESFAEKDAPQYAILSHTWGKDHEEISFRDLENGTADQSSLGWTKLKGCCEQARLDNIDYAWIDTCCIDKSDLAELNEAINSMYRWYRQSAICYTYMADVDSTEEPSSTGSKFRKSRWFTRGWTLQELVAPQTVRFYGSDWQCIGNKAKMCSTIMEITGVPRAFLLGISDLSEASIAQRMSWAARRKTTKDEDLAYCLIGIFNVTMQMIYGEGGPLAFLRLQDEILKVIRDDSILAWGFRPDGTLVSEPGPVIGDQVLATSPRDFAHCEDIVVRSIHKSAIGPKVAGGHLRMCLPLVAVSPQNTMGLLSCGPRTDPNCIMAIPLAVPSNASSQEYIRPQGHHAVLLRRAQTIPEPELIHVRFAEQRPEPSGSGQELWLCEIDTFIQVGLDLIDVTPRSSYDPNRALITPSVATGSLKRTMLRFRRRNQEARDFVVVLEKPDPAIETRCYIMVCSRDTSIWALANEKFHAEVQKPLGEQGASDGSLHIQVLLEDAGHDLFTIKPQRMSEAPEQTLDASVELQRLL